MRALTISVLTLAVLTSVSVARAAEDGDGPHVRATVRFDLLFREDDGYFHDARVFAEAPSVTTKNAHLAGDPIPPAGGVAIEVGVEFVPRVSIMGSFRTLTNGVKTGDDMRLSLNTQAWIADVRWAVLRAQTGHHDDGPSALAQIELIAGAGLYRLREEFVDRALFDGTLMNSMSRAGGRFGIDASAYIVGVGFVVGYAYDATSATISDRLGESLRGGGHEITIGLAFRF